MKRILYLMLLISAILCGCKQEEDIAGGYAYRNIYIVEGEELIDAQNHNLSFPKEGGSVSLLIAGPSDDIYGISRSDWLSIDKEGDVSLVGKYSYRQGLMFTVPQNDTGKDRSCKATVVSWVCNGYAAEFTITQAGK